MVEMKKTHSKRLILLASIFSAALLWSLSAGEVAAQCALCRTALQNSGESVAQTLNLAILVLLIPPVAIFCSFFAVAVKMTKNEDERDGDGHSS